MSSLFFATPASATEMTLEEAQAALVLAQQEVVDATTALETATADVASATGSRDEAQVAYNEALAAWEATRVTHPGTSSTVVQDVVQNGTFDNTANWTNVVASSTVYTGGASPIIYNGKLKGSYTAGIYIQQTGTFPSPTRQVAFSVDVWNYDTNEGNRANNPDYYRIEFRTYDAAGNRLNYYNIEVNSWHNWMQRTASYTLSADAVSWDIGFRMADGGYWAGAFGPEMDNVHLYATMGTTTPETYTYGEAETAAKNIASGALQTATASYNSAVSAKESAQTRYNTAISEVTRLTSLVAELIPHLNAPTGLTVTLNGDHVDLSWNAPEPNLSGVQVERYAIMWSTTHFTQNGWGWNHDQTTVSIPLSVLNQAGGLGSNFQFEIRADNNTLHIYSARSNTVSLQTVEPDWWQVQFNENDTVTIGAPDGYVFGVPRAWYGTPDGTCGLDVSSIVSDAIRTRATASFVANNDLFTDPCPGWGKVLRMRTPIVAVPVIEPTPTPTPTETPVIIVPEPTPAPTPEPTVEPTPLPSEEPTVEPTPTPTVPSEGEPTPTPTETTEPVEKPTENVVDETPTPEPSETPEVQPEPELRVDEAVSEIENLVEIAPEELTDAQVEQLVEAALVVFETAEQGSEEYNQALEALAVAAEADDPEVPSELAAIPLLGDVAGAALEVFNNLGNVGADMSPQIREEAEKTVIASVIAAGAAVNAVAAATTAASAPTGGSTSGGSSGGSGSSTRRND